MKEPTFLTYDSEDSIVDITWATKEKRLCVIIDADEGMYMFGVSKTDIIDFDLSDFSGAYKWFEEE